MRRRQFTTLLSAGAMAIAFRPTAGIAAAKPQVAITMDDFDLFGDTDAEKEANSREILASLGSHSNLKAAAFICGRRVDSEMGKRVLQAWNWERSVYYDDLSRRALGRSVKHTLLVHHNLLNKLFLGDLLTMFERKGWKLIDAAEAFTDPVFAAEPKILPAGESILWALAKESGKFDRDLRYPGEDSVYEKPKMDRLGL